MPCTTSALASNGWLCVASTVPGGQSSLQLVDVAELQLTEWTQEAVATAQIEGEVLQVNSVRASAARRLGLPGAGPDSDLGKRPNQDFDKIVSLYVAARAGHTLRGEDIVVAAEKAGLSFGHMDVFHRLVDGKPELGPIFSGANIIKPGSLEMARIAEIEAPAIAFCLTLPAPVAALDAWETMEPAAQRMADLLDGVVLDEERNALGRQRIQHIRDELRAYDRQHSAPPLSKPTRW